MYLLSFIYLGMSYLDTQLYRECCRCWYCLCFAKFTDLQYNISGWSSYKRKGSYKTRAVQTFSKYPKARIWSIILSKFYQIKNLILSFARLKLVCFITGYKSISLYQITHLFVLCEHWRESKTMGTFVQKYFFCLLIFW